MPVPYRVVFIALVGLVLSLVVVARATAHAGDATQDAAILVTLLVWTVAVIVIELRYRFQESNAGRKEATH